MLPEEEREEEEEEEGAEDDRRGWTPGEAGAGGSIHIDTGRGQAVEVQAGASFRETLERVADEAHYGGYYRVFLNGVELINPEDAPDTVEAGMRIAVTAYDKVG